MARRTPKRLQRKQWDPLTTNYASLDSPEWLDRVPLKFWEDPHNHKRYMKWLAIQLGIEKPEDWYKVQCKHFMQNHGTHMLQYYPSPGASVNAIRAYIPNRKWHEWLFPCVPNGFWIHRENRLKYRDWLGKRLSFRKVTDWYGLSQRILKENHGFGLMSRFDQSPSKLVADFFPDLDWKPWLFKQAPMDFWAINENRRDYLLWLEKQLSIAEPEDWYDVTIKDFNENHGGTLMQYYGNIGFEGLLDDLYPGRQWLRWRFHQTTKGFWNKKENRLQYLQWLGQELGFHDVAAWLKLRSHHFLQSHGHQIYTAFYKCDLTRPLKEMFPGQEFRSWMFPKTPGGFWRDQTNRTMYVRWLGRKLGLRSNQDWYSLRPRQFEENHGSKLVSTYGPICRLVCEAFPKRNFYPWLFTRVPKRYWHSAQNRNLYFDWLSRQLRIKLAADWDKITIEDLRHCQASTVLTVVYGNSKSRFLRAAKRPVCGQGRKLSA